MATAAYDLAYVSSSSMAQYVADVEIPVVMDFVDVDSDKWAQYARRARAPLSWLYRAESAGLRRYEGRIARWAISQRGGKNHEASKEQYQGGENHEKCKGQ